MSPVSPGGAALCPLTNVPILRLGQNTEVVQILDDFLGVWLHWKRGQGRPRSTACRSEGCRDCQAGLHRVGYGYAPALRSHSQTRRLEPSIVCVSTDYRSLFPAHPRGGVFNLRWRSVQGNFGALDVVAREELTGEPSHPGFSVIPALCRALGVGEDQLATFVWAELEAHGFTVEPVSTSFPTTQQTADTSRANGSPSPANGRVDVASLYTPLSAKTPDAPGSAAAFRAAAQQRGFLKGGA